AREHPGHRGQAPPGVVGVSGDYAAGRRRRGAGSRGSTARDAAPAASRAAFLLASQLNPKPSRSGRGSSPTVSWRTIVMTGSVTGSVNLGTRGRNTLAASCRPVSLTWIDPTVSRTY